MSGAAVKETSYYPPLANLLNEIGKKLKPRVQCIIHLQDTGGGLPDGGLFTEEQLRNEVSDILAGAIPARGAIEAKPATMDAWKIAESKQVKDYWSHYRQVLVTNYRDFLLLGADADGNRAVLETYRLARDENEFWQKAKHPRAAADQEGSSFEEFLKRVALYQAPLATPRDLAWFLASYAREAKFRIETGELPTLVGIRNTLEEALGLRFEGARGDHFFRSALIQTLFYGIFSAWVLWSKSHPPSNKKSGFEWRTSPARVEAAYLSWPLLPELFPVSFPGVKTSRDDVVTDIDRDRLLERMRAYFDPEVSHEDIAKLAPGAMQRTAGFDAKKVRALLRKRGMREATVVHYCYRPFDVRWIYWEPEANLLDRPRPELFAQIDTAGYFIEARQRQPMEEFDRGYVKPRLADNFGNGLSSFFPMMVRDPSPLHVSALPKPNLSAIAESYLASIGADCKPLFFHIVATLHAPAYKAENQGALKQDWPRIPLPARKSLLTASAVLGREVAELHDPERSSPQGAKALKSIGIITAADGTLNPDAGDLELTAGWGHAGKGGVTMPAKGKVTVREMTTADQRALPEGALQVLSEQTCDVWLNDRAYWRNIPVPVWEYTLGGYQVIKKWLSYREKELLGRSLTVEEARYVTDMARRIAAILLMSPALDANYSAVKQATYDLTGTAEA